MERIYDGTGRPIVRDTHVSNAEGRTSIQLADQEGLLYCEFKIDEDQITLSFQDKRLADRLLHLAVIGEFVGFQLDWKYMEARDGGKEEAPNSGSGGPTVQETIETAHPGHRVESRDTV